MQTSRPFLVFLVLSGVAWADEARRLEWKPRTGDRYDFAMSSTVVTEDTTQGKEKETRHEAQVEGEIRVVEVTDEKAKGVLRFRRIRATFDREKLEAKVDLGEKELSRASVKVEIDLHGVLKVDDSDLNDLARGVELGVHFAGLFFRLPDDPVKEDQEWDLDKGPISLHLRLRDIRDEGEDELAIFDGEAKAKEARGGARATARGKVAVEFNVTQGYLRLLDEDYTTKLTTSTGKFTFSFTRRLSLTRTREK